MWNDVFLISFNINWKDWKKILSKETTLTNLQCFAVSSVNCSFCSVQYEVWGVQYSVLSEQYPVFNVQCEVCSVQYAVCSV